MNKEEVLQASRAQKEDEGQVYAEQYGRKIGYAAFSVLFAGIVVFNLFTGQSNSVPFTLFWAFFGAEAFGKYRVTKKKSYLFTTVCAAVAAVCFLAAYVIKTLQGNV
jgi:hypothetical protein